jgi:hypothetical protein
MRALAPCGGKRAVLVAGVGGCGSLVGVVLARPLERPGNISVFVQIYSISSSIIYLLMMILTQS